MKQHHFIRRWREHRGLTQQQVADRIELARSTVTKIESFDRPYTQETLEALAMALNCEPSDLLRPPPIPNDPGDELRQYAKKLNKTDQAKAAAVLRALFTNSNAA